MHPCISITGSIHWFFHPSVGASVSQSVSLSVCWLVGPSSKTRGIIILANKCKRCKRWHFRLTRCILASLLSSPSICWSVSPLICLSRFHWYPFQQVRARGSQEECDIITSSCSHSISMRMHRWSYGTCFSSSFHRKKQYLWNRFLSTTTVTALATKDLHTKMSDKKGFCHCH